MVPDSRLPRTCCSCAHYKRTIVRHQWENVCWLTGKTAPMRICLSYVNARL